MSLTTSKLGLTKPELTDAADITATNRNWDIVDEEISKLKENANGNYSAKSIVVNATLLASSWENRVYKWYNNGIKSANQIIELLPQQSITAAQLTALQAANIVGTSQGVGSVTLTAYGDVPTIDIPITFIIRGDV